MPLNRSELETIYNELEGPLYNFAFRWVFNSALAEELVHEAFLRIWNGRQNVETATIKSLLYKTIQNLALNEIRKRKVRDAFKALNPFDSGEQKNAEDQLVLGSDLKSLKVSLERLPIDLKEVLLLSEFSDFSYQEIAATLDIAEGTVASRKNRALQMMRESFASRGGKSL